MRLLLGAASSPENVGAADQQAWIDPKPPSNKDKHDDGTNAQAAAAAWNTESAPGAHVAAPVFYVVASRKLIKTHTGSPFSERAASAGSNAAAHAPTA
jgi:hypothetical protein